MVTLRTTIPAPDDANTTALVNTPYPDAAIVKHLPLDRADLVVDRVYMLPANPKVGDNLTTRTTTGTPR